MHWIKARNKDAFEVAKRFGREKSWVANGSWQHQKRSHRTSPAWGPAGTARAGGSTTSGLRPAARTADATRGPLAGARSEGAWRGCA